MSKFDDDEVEEEGADDDEDIIILVATTTATSALFSGTDAALGRTMGYEGGRTNADDAEEEDEAAAAAAARDTIRRKKVETPATGATMVSNVSGLRPFRSAKIMFQFF